MNKLILMTFVLIVLISCEKNSIDSLIEEYSVVPTWSKYPIEEKLHKHINTLHSTNESMIVVGPFFFGNYKF